MTKLHKLPCTKLTPELLLHGLIEHLDDIESVVVIIDYKNKPMSVEVSDQKCSTLCMSEKVLSMRVSELLEED